MSQTDVTLVTCADYPQLDPDDLLLANALKALGVRVSVAVWSDPDVDWSATEISVIRSTWDYHRCTSDFLSWVEQASVCCKLFNDADLIRSNIEKTYLQNFAENGLSVIPTKWLKRQADLSPAAIAELFNELMQAFGKRIVIKPAVGLGGSGVTQLELIEHSDSIATFAQTLLQLRTSGAVMVQPFVHSVLERGEHSLIFFEGKFSHAIRKSPFAQMALAGCAGEKAIDATAEQIRFGEQVLAQLVKIPLYARVDVVEFHERLHLMELELIEPSLYFSYSNNAEDGLAALIASKL